MLKKIRLIGMACLVLATLVLFSSCSKDKQIVGKWKITKAIVDGEDASVFEKGKTWEFKDGGKCTLYIDGLDWEGEYTLNDNTLSILVEYNGEHQEKISADLTLNEFSKKEMSVSGNASVAYNTGELGWESWTEDISYEFEKM